MKFITRSLTMIITLVLLLSVALSALFTYQDNEFENDVANLKLDYFSALNLATDFEDDFFLEKQMLFKSIGIESLLRFFDDVYYAQEDPDEESSLVMDELNTQESPNIEFEEDAYQRTKEISRDDFLGAVGELAFIVDNINRHKNNSNSSTNIFLIDNNKQIVFSLYKKPLIYEMVNYDPELIIHNKISYDDSYVYPVKIEDPETNELKGILFFSWSLLEFLREYHDMYNNVRNNGSHYVGVFLDVSQEREECFYNTGIVSLEDDTKKVNSADICRAVYNLNDRGALQDRVNIINSRDIMLDFRGNLFIMKKDSMLFVFLYEDIRDREIYTAITLLTVIIIIFSISNIYYFLVYIDNNFKKINKHIASMARGDLSFNVPVNEVNEIGSIFHSFLNAKNNLINNFTGVQKGIQEMETYFDKIGIVSEEKSIISELDKHIINKDKDSLDDLKNNKYNNNNKSY